MATNKEEAIKTKLLFDGEAEYKKACSEINNSLYTMSNQMKLVTAQYADNAKSSEALTAKQDILKKQFEEQEKKVAETEAALKKLESQENRNEDAERKYQNELLKAQTALAKTGNELKAVEKDLAAAADKTDDFGGEVKAAGNDLNATEKDLTNAGKEASSFGKEVKKSGEESDAAGGKFQNLSKTIGTVASAFGTALAAIGTTAVAVGAALAGVTVSAAGTANSLLDQSQITRQSVEDLQKYAYATQFVGLEMSTLTGAMTKTITSMSSARNGTGAIAEAYAQLGISVTAADGSLRDSNEVFWETIDALGNVQNETERDALAMQLLGKSAKDLTVLINTGSDAFKAYGDEAEAMGIVMGENQVQQLGDFNNALTRLTSSLGGLKNAAAMIALPFMNTLANEGTAILADFSKGIQACGGDISQMGEVVGETLGNMIALVVKKLPELVSMGVSIIKAVVKGIADNSGVLVTAAFDIIDTLVNALGDLLPMIINGALMLVKGLAAGLQKNLPALIPTVIAMILSIIQTIAENIPLIIDCALMIIEGLVVGILNALPVLIQMLPTLIVTIVNAIVEGIPKIFLAAANIITGLVDGLINAIPMLVEMLPTIIVTIVTGLINGLPDILASAGQIILSIVEGLIKGIPQLLAAIPQIITGIVNAFASGETNFFEIGVNIMKGLWEGLKSMFTSLWNGVKDFFGNLVNGVKDFLGIKSPSKVFAGIGLNMAAGVGVGFTEEMKAVTADIKNAIPTEFDTDTEINFNPTKPRPAASGGSYAPLNSSDSKANAVYVTQNIYTPQYDYAEQQREAAKQFKQIARQV